MPNIRGDLDDIQRQDLVIIYLFGYNYIHLLYR